MEATEPVVRRRSDRQFRTTEEKRFIVEATRRTGVSVAAVAQAHGVNANQVFYWRKLYEAGQLECKAPSRSRDIEPARVCLLPVTVDAEEQQPLAAACKSDQRTSSCSSEGFDRVDVGARAGAPRGRGGLRDTAHGVAVSAGMISAPVNTQIWLAAGVTDMRRGFTGLSALVQTALEQAPLSGHVFAFRGRRGDLIKLLWFDGDGLCLFSKKLERGRFIWPQADSGKVSLTRAQLSMLLEGIDWRRPERTWQPAMTV